MRARERVGIVVLAVFLATGAMSIVSSGQVTPYSDELTWQQDISNPTLCDFDAFVGNVGGQYTGAVFGPFNSGTPLSTSLNSGFSPNTFSGFNFMISSQAPGYGGLGWKVDFSPPVSGVGFWTAGLQFSGSSVELFDQQNTSLGLFDLLAVASDPGEFTWTFTGFVSAQANISRIEVVIISTDYVGHDDFQFGNAAVPPTCVPPPADVVSWWPGDGDASDIVGSNDGTLQNGASITSGLVGQAFSFDGVNDQVFIPDSSSLDTGATFSVETWFRTNDATRTQGIVNYGLNGQDGRTGALQIRNGVLKYVVRGTSGAYADVIGVTPVQTGMWHHGAFTYDGSHGRVYLDGALEKTQTTTIANVLNSRVLLGRQQNGASGAYIWPFTGLIDEAAIYDRALTPAEIQAIFSAGSAGKCKAPPNQPPTADAGPDFSVDEGQLGVQLDGSGSSDPDNDPLTHEWTQLSGTLVNLSDVSAEQPTFDAPFVAVGGETLTFQLTVTANGEDSTDVVSVTIVNVNHPPVADAGLDQSIAEGSPVTLHGEDSFDIDTDPFTYAWMQVGGSPVVTLTGADTANPTFTAPFGGIGGAPGVVATLEFELVVDDGLTLDAPAPGYTFEDVADTVTIEITNLNNDPTANAGMDQTVDENTMVSLSGTLSTDPDSDPLTYEWSQTTGPAVIGLTGQFSATTSFTVPFVSPGGEDVTFQLTVEDDYGGSAVDTVIVHVQNANDPPDPSAAMPTIDTLWPPNHRLVSVGIIGVTDPDDNATITITAVTQDEPTNGTGDGDTAIDAFINPDGTVLLRAERTGGGSGRVYHIHFTASDLEGSASGVVTVSVPKKKKDTVIDDGELYDSTN